MDLKSMPSFFRKLFSELVSGRGLAVRARLNQDLSVVLRDKIKLPLKTSLKINLEDYVTIEGSLPIKTEVRVDTVVETDVLKFGIVKIPIQATIPIVLNVPLANKIKVRLQEIPITLNDTIEISIPELIVPVATEVRATVTI